MGAVAPRSAYLWCFGFRDTVRVPAAVAGLPAGYCSATGKNRLGWGVSFGSVPATPQVNLVGSFLDLPTLVGRLPPEMGKPTSMQGCGRITELPRGGLFCEPSQVPHPIFRRGSPPEETLGPFPILGFLGLLKGPFRNRCRNLYFTLGRGGPPTGNSRTVKNFGFGRNENLIRIKW